MRTVLLGLCRAWLGEGWNRSPLDLGDENIPGGEGRVVQVRTNLSGLLGCVRRGVRALCDRDRDGVPCGAGPAALHPRAKGNEAARKVPQPFCVWARPWASRLPLHASSSLRLTPLNLGRLPSPGRQPHWFPAVSEVLQAHRLTWAR